MLFVCRTMVRCLSVFLELCVAFRTTFPFCRILNCLPHCSPYRIQEDFSMGGACALFGSADDCDSLLVYFLLPLGVDLIW